MNPIEQQQAEAARLRETEIQREMVSCVHFNGVHKTVCLAGVNMRDLVGDADQGWARKLPCVPQNLNGDEPSTAVCVARHLPSREEAEKMVDEQAERLITALLTIADVKENAAAKGYGAGKGGISTMPCPACEDGTIRYIVATSGKTHGKCSTQGCVSWAE